MQVQGSGRVASQSGAVRLGYDGKERHPYTSIGRLLIERGATSRRCHVDGGGEGVAQGR
jgi:membrane-bound lytic murein transglycosylase A